MEPRAPGNSSSVQVGEGVFASRNRILSRSEPGGPFQASVS